MKSLEALRALGSGTEAPLEAKQRVYGSVLAALELAAAGSTAATVASKVSSPPLVAGVTSSKALLVAAGIWLFGGATGALLYGALHPERVRVVYVDHPVLSAAPTAPLAAISAVSVSSASAPPPSASAARVASPLGVSALSTERSNLAAERALLDSARSAAAQGEPARVLERVAQHEERFPRGHLVEEREALAIRALLALGRNDEARARADAFRAAYPHSFLMPVIDSALSAP